ncbi:hypothetical protein QEN42_07670 [Gordonia alkanivorans]|uniref:hypothetical protein n=1 Tax=Gordonia alkanivorans TaxID=84096 RepID=UPI0024485CB8|nr:hypothetical protein [Gordonia alkanivorans]MDH3049753.1 hypothetical protein [Gordonia alkanivorans]
MIESVCRFVSSAHSLGVLMFYVVVGVLVVAALVMYGDRLQRRQELVGRQDLVEDLVPVIVERVKAQLEVEMGDAIAGVQDAILVSLSEVIREAVERDSVLLDA